MRKCWTRQVFAIAEVQSPPGNQTLSKLLQAAGGIGPLPTLRHPARVTRGPRAKPRSAAMEHDNKGITPMTKFMTRITLLHEHLPPLPQDHNDRRGKDHECKITDSTVQATTHMLNRRNHLILISQPLPLRPRVQAAGAHRVVLQKKAFQHEQLYTPVQG